MLRRFKSCRLHQWRSQDGNHGPEQLEGALGAACLGQAVCSLHHARPRVVDCHGEAAEIEHRDIVRRIAAHDHPLGLDAALLKRQAQTPGLVDSRCADVNREARRDDDEVGPLGVREKLAHQVLVLLLEQAPLGLAPAVRLYAGWVEAVDLGGQPLRGCLGARAVG
ncbi:MAG: hypothetical protein DSY41_02415 [Candidatus Poseidoniales archaeon]|nr:MAG: hypothetical protein DSY41_02415 [Candidatus Poseidoniales archaeon]